MRHPFQLTKDEIAELDEVWLAHVYWHALDPKSIGSPTERIRISPKATGKALSRREEWLAHGRRFGWPDSYSLAQWEEEKAAAKARKDASSTMAVKTVKPARRKS